MTTASDSPVPPAGPSRPMPRLGQGRVWSELVAEMEREHAARQAAFKEPVTELTNHPSTVTSPAEIETPTPSELPAAPNLGVREELGGTEGGGGAPNLAVLEQLGARLDAGDFAEALAPGGIIESTVEAGRAVVITPLPAAFPPRGGIVRQLSRFRRRPR